MLPQEVITKILDYLPFNDRKNLSLTNTKWYYASLHPTVIKNDWFINRQYSKVDDDFQQTIMKTKRTFFNLELYFQHNNPSIFEGLGNRIISLHLKNVTCFDDRFLNCITDSCNILKSLTLEDTAIRHLNYNPRKLLLNMQSLTLNAVYLSDNIFNIIMQCCPNLENLGLLRCNITNTILFSKEFSNTNMWKSLPSGRNCLKDAKNINSLQIDNCLIFMYLPAHIKLKNLTLHSFRPIYFDDSIIDIKELILLLSKQVSLEELSIEFLPCCLLSAVSKLQNLKCLDVHFTTNSSQKCNVDKLCVQKFVESLSYMKKLKELSIIPWDEKIQRAKPESFNSIPAIPDCTLRLLTSIDCFIENRLQILQFSNNLKSLHIQNAEILISSDFHLIFNNFLNLECLRLTNCINLNDSIFEELPVSNLKELISFQFDGSITYKCLKYIRLIKLKCLKIKNMSTKTRWNNSDNDFEETYREFCRATALISFHLYISYIDLTIAIEKN